MAVTCTIKLEDLKQLKQYATTHEITIEEYAQIYKRQKPFVGDRKEYMYTNDYYKFVFSIESMPSLDFKKIYNVKRFSASVNIPNKYPSVELVRMIIKYLGLNDLEKCTRNVNENDIIPHIEIVDMIGEKNLTNDEQQNLQKLFF